MRGTALITGGAIRLGRAFALGLAEMGYDIAIHFNRSQSEAESVVSKVRQIGVRCECFQSDFSKETNFESLMTTVGDRLSNLNLLVNSASVYDAAPIGETTPELFDQQFAVNLRAPYFLTQAFSHYYQSQNYQSQNRQSEALQSGNFRPGNIINIIDNKIAFNQYHYAAYLLSKKALAELTKLAALELAPNIRVNGIAPGVTLPATERSDEYVQWRVKGIPLQRQGTIDYLLQAMQYILDNDFVTGQILMVDGGESLTNVGRNSENYSSSSKP